jgi:cell division protein FtsA
MPAGTSSSKKKNNARKVVELNPPKKVKSGAGATQYDPNEIIFALDIGTRTVVGIVGVQEKDVFKVLAAEVIEHKNRAMMDGQIHDIRQVAEVAGEVRERLVKSTGIPLTRVAIAAAGRVLKTCEVKIERDMEQGREVDSELVSSLEMEAIQKAQLKLDEEIVPEEKTQFYCVGYSVLNYYLNGYVISSLNGHRGKKVGVEILATFLPHIVVDSLYTVMNRIGLEVSSLTLEPIAAINVTIPKDLRLLNLVLVDIGAGTSDIAITKDGSVIAYAMAPIAGDEITEQISQHYLVDFNMAEKIKIALSSPNDTISFTDILGIKHSIRPEEALEVVKPSVDFLAQTIAQKILEYNHKAPNAVFLIGGGSQIQGLTENIAYHLKLPGERVVVRGRELLKNIKYKGRKLTGPECITPLGIAVTAQLQRGQDFLEVTINGNKVRLFNSKRLMVADALILIGYNPGHLIGRSGKSVTFECNGVRKVVRGEYGKAAEIQVNGKPASLETVIGSGDDIFIIPAENGMDAVAKVTDIAGDGREFQVTLNGNRIQAGTRIFINGSQAAADSSIHEGDTVTTSEIATLQGLIKISEIDTSLYDIMVNGQEATINYLLKDGDVIECVRMGHTDIRTCLAGDASELVPEAKEVPAPVEPEIMEVHGIEPEWAANGGTCVTVNGKPVVLSGDKAQYIFVDIFNYIQFDLSRPQGTIVLRLNGKQAAFADEIKSGDNIEIFWDK